MILCTCNRLSSAAIDIMLKETACTRVSDIFAYFRVSPDCGRCATALRERLQTHHDDQPGIDPDRTIA